MVLWIGSTEISTQRRRRRCWRLSSRGAVTQHVIPCRDDYSSAGLKTPGRREDNACAARTGKRPHAGGAERGRAHAPPLITRMFCCVLLSLMPVICLLLMMFCSCYCSSFFCCSNSVVLLYKLAVPFPGIPLAGRAVVNGASGGCLRPGGLPSLTPKTRFAATGTVAPPLSRRDLRSWHPGKKTPGM